MTVRAANIPIVDDPDDALSDQRRYERALIDERLGDGWRGRVVIFGAGRIGRDVLRGLRQMGIEPVVFCDNAADHRGRVVDGIDVVGPMELAEVIDDPRVIVAVWRSAAVLDQLRQASIERAVSFKALFWHRPALFLPYMRLDLPSRLLEASAAIERVAAALDDERSREEFARQLDWLGSFESYALPVVAGEQQYFAFDLFEPRADDVFVDCGAFDGDTAMKVLRYWPAGVVIHALEPEPANLRALKSWRADLPVSVREEVHLHPYASADRRGPLKFASAGPGSAISETGELVVQAVTLDELLGHQRVTIIKMDIEGAEVAALRGAATLLRRDRPIVAACLYHRQRDLWEVPELLLAAHPAYRLFIRRYGDEYGDVVCYAIPPERLIHDERGVRTCY